MRRRPPAIASALRHFFPSIHRHGYIDNNLCVQLLPVSKPFCHKFKNRKLTFESGTSRIRKLLGPPAPCQPAPAFAAELGALVENEQRGTSDDDRPYQSRSSRGSRARGA